MKWNEKHSRCKNCQSIKNEPQEQVDQIAWLGWLFIAPKNKIIPIDSAEIKFLTTKTNLIPYQQFFILVVWLDLRQNQLLVK